MKVLAIQGSPHRGNTYECVERFGQALTALGDVEFEHVALKDVRLEPCRGCFLCFDRGEETCPLRDDRPGIERKLCDADGVIFATPVYSMHISYLLKLFVDRFAYTFHRPRYFDTYAVGMAVTGGIGLKEALTYIRMFSSSWGFQYLGELRFVAPPKNTGLSNLPPIAEERDRTEETARKLHHAMATRPPRRLSVKDYLHFHAMRAVYSRMEPFSPTDYAYWKRQGWLEPGARYFSPNVKGSALKSLYPRFLAWVLGRRMDKVVSTPERPTSVFGAVANR